MLVLTNTTERVKVEQHEEQLTSNVLTNKLPRVDSLMHLRDVAVFYSTQLRNRTSNKTFDEKLVVNFFQILCDRTLTSDWDLNKRNTSHEKLTTSSCISSEQREKITVQSENFNYMLNTNMSASFRLPPAPLR